MKLRNRPLRQRSEKQAHRDRQLSRVKRLLLQRASWRCQLCQARDTALELHHVFGRSWLGERWFADPDVLAVLCPPCHESLTNPRTDLEHAAEKVVQKRSIARLRARVDPELRIEDADLRRTALLLCEAIERASETETA